MKKRQLTLLKLIYNGPPGLSPGQSPALDVHAYRVTTHVYIYIYI